MLRASAMLLGLWLWPVAALAQTEGPLVASEPMVLKHPAIADNYGNAVHCLVFTNRDTLLATGAAAGVFIWDAAKGELRHKLKVDERGVDALVGDPRGAFLVAGGASGIIKTWDTQTWKETRNLGPTSGAVRGLAISPDGKLLASASPNGQRGDKDPDFGVILWDLTSGQKLRTLHVSPPAFGTTRLAFTPDGKTILVGQDRMVRLLDVETGKEMRAVQLRGVVRSLGAMSLRPDGRALATGIFEPKIRIWDTASWEQTLAWDAHEKDPPPRQGVVSVAFSPDGQFVISGGMDGMVGVWLASTGQRLLQLDARNQASQGWITGVTMSADGRLLAASHLNGAATIWRISGQTKAQEPRSRR